MKVGGPRDSTFISVPLASFGSSCPTIGFLDVKVPEPQTPHFSVELGTLIIPKTSASPNHTL
ncbi:hypothetical protein CMI48_03230 [Candidatus Pacearchaeota archaeon]|nr:hypothetical protein [Candidatus Pacearchaeota archaeon]